MVDDVAEESGSISVNDLLSQVRVEGGEEKSPLSQLISSEDIDMKTEVLGTAPNYKDLVRAKFFADRYRIPSVHAMIESELKFLVSKDRKGREEILKAIASVLSPEAQVAEESGRSIWGRLLR